MQALTAGIDKTNSAESLVLYAKAKRSQVGGTGNGMRNINNGVDIITCNDEGKIVEFKVMIRPLQAVNLMHEKMAAMLQKMGGA